MAVYLIKWTLCLTTVYLYHRTWRFYFQFFPHNPSILVNMAMDILTFSCIYALPILHSG